MAQQLRWEKTNKDKRNLLRYAKSGMTFYSVRELDRRSLAPKHMCDRWTVTRHSTIGGPMVGSSSLESILFEHGPLYTEPIISHKGQPLHPMWEPLPQVSGPLGDDTERHLDEVELRSMKKLSDEAADRRRKNKSGKRGWL